MVYHERAWLAEGEERESNGGCSSGVERLTVAQEVAGSKPVIRPTSLLFNTPPSSVSHA